MTEPSKRKVTIGIPTFRRPELLRRALDSVAQQDYQPLEVIVADNATEGHEVDAVIAAFRDRIDGLRYVRHETNIGAVDNFEFCLAAATGDFFMWLADDDELAPHSLAALARPLETDTSVVTVVPYWRFMRSPDTGWVVEQRVYESHSALLRVLRYVWRANDAFYYGLHRRADLLRCRFIPFLWPNATLGYNSTYPYLMTLVLAGRIVSAPDPRVEWINHSYSEKSYQKPGSLLVYVPKHILRRINLHAIYFVQVYRSLGILASLAVASVSIASLATEFVTLPARKLSQALGLPVEALPAAKKP